MDARWWIALTKDNFQITCVHVTKPESSGYFFAMHAFLPQIIPSRLFPKNAARVGISCVSDSSRFFPSTHIGDGGYDSTRWAIMHDIYTDTWQTSQYVRDGWGQQQM